MKGDRRYAIKKGMLDYILQDEEEQERLGVLMPIKVCIQDIIYFRTSRHKLNFVYPCLSRFVYNISYILERVGIN